MLSDDIKFFSEWSNEFRNKEDKIVEWFENNKMAFDDAKDIELLQMIFNYITSNSMKEIKKHVNKLFKETFNERVSEALPHVGKLGMLLHDGMSTKKGRELSDMLVDLANNPDDYFYKVEQVKANLNDIKSFLQDIGIRVENRNKLLTIIQ